jgi:acetoin utilization deacetylase AcuC-like enzyme
MQLNVHFTKKMVADAGSFSPSAGKPAQVLESWAKLGLDLNIVEPAPATTAQLMAAHDVGYVYGVLNGTRTNGFGNMRREVATSLPYTSGSMLSAARDAIASGTGAISPTSGFHHAGWDFGGGFCTFNGLMVTAVALLDEYAATRVGILDLDEHWGNGTEDIIHELGLEGRVVHYHPSDFGTVETARRWLDSLPIVLQLFKDCSVVLYQAGADPHIDDPLGGWLTTAQLVERDHIVFTELRKMGVPVAWNLAGGYQRDADGGIRPVLDVHDNTLLAFNAVWSD